MSYYFKISSLIALFSFFIPAQASFLNQGADAAPASRSTPSLTPLTSLNDPLPIHLKVLSGLLERVEAEEREPTPDLKSLIESYNTPNKETLYPPILLHRLTLELKHTKADTPGYETFFKQTYLKGFYALHFFLKSIPSTDQDQLFNWDMFFSVLKEKSEEIGIEHTTPV